MMKKNLSLNTKYRVIPRYLVRNNGNWNRKHLDKKLVLSKPLGVFVLEGNEYIWKHQDILDLIKLYCDVDEMSIRMIDDPDVDTGEVVVSERPLKHKILELLDNYFE